MLRFTYSFCNGKPWRQCRDEVLNAYKVDKSVRRERFAEVMAGLRDYSAEQLDGELLDLHETSVYISLPPETNIRIVILAIDRLTDQPNHDPALPAGSHS